MKPASALAPGHLDSETATVTFAGLAVNGVTPPPEWDRATATCATYCHGAKTGRTAPAWTSVGTASCGTCHSLPPEQHPSVSGDPYACTLCHPQTMDGPGNVIAPSAGGTHLNGVVDVAGWDSSCSSCH